MLDKLANLKEKVLKSLKEVETLEGLNELKISILGKKGEFTALMKEMLRILKDRGYKQVSLSVQKANYAVDMYQKTGFEIVDEKGEEYSMLCRL